MKWQIETNRPIYLQLVEQIQFSILSGEFQPGERLPSVRDLAEEAGVNPNTVQRAMTELEQKGLVYPQRTAGRFITDNTFLIQSLKEECAKNALKSFMDQMQKIGLRPEDLIQLIQTSTSQPAKDVTKKEISHE